jgi:hypothetical protein
MTAFCNGVITDNDNRYHPNEMCVTNENIVASIEKLHDDLKLIDKRRTSLIRRLSSISDATYFQTRARIHLEEMSFYDPLTALKEITEHLIKLQNAKKRGNYYD